MLEFSDESKRLVSTFFAYRNDIDIYTEDQLEDKEFYRVLFERLIDRSIQIKDITPLGSKKNVIERCQNEPENGRKKIFIVDGDIQIIHGQNIPALKNLFVLDAYCIENLLLTKDSVVHFIYLNCGAKSKEEIEKELAYADWLKIYSEKLIDLFIHFALVDLFGGSFSLANAVKFHKKEKSDLVFSEEAINREIEEVVLNIRSLTTEENYREKYDELKAKWNNSIETLFTIVSGKDILIPILLIKTQAFKNSRALPSVFETKFALSQYCDLTRMSRLKVAIEAI